MTNRLVHRPITLILGVICFLFFSSMVVVQIAVPNKTVTVWTIALFAGFALFSLILTFGYFLESYELSEEGVAFRTLFGVKKSLRWADLRTVRYSTAMRWFHLKAQSGTTARISIMLKGLPEFARLVQHKAPRKAIDDQTLDVLRATAGGHPPSLLT